MFFFYVYFFHHCLHFCQLNNYSEYPGVFPQTMNWEAEVKFNRLLRVCFYEARPIHDVPPILEFTCIATSASLYSIVSK